MNLVSVRMLVLFLIAVILEDAGHVPCFTLSLVIYAWECGLFTSARGCYW